MLTYAVLYVIASIVIGVIVGKWSLKVWKEPKKYPVLGFILFPFSQHEGWIGGTTGGDGNLLGLCNINPDADLKITEPLETRQAKYIILTIVFLPARFCCILALMLFVGLVLKLPAFLLLGASKLLMKCPKCVKL